ncbi:MAG: hypothetical protein QXZ17_09200 [Nitrososphaerota archaeon]
MSKKPKSEEEIKESVTIYARAPVELRDKLKEYRKRHGLRSFNQAIIHILESLEV